MADMNFSPQLHLQLLVDTAALPAFRRQCSACTASPALALPQSAPKDIQAATGVSDTIVNIVRGILGFLQVTVKTTQKVYELEEVLCHFNFNIKYDVHFVKNVNHHVLG